MREKPNRAAATTTVTLTLMASPRAVEQPGPRAGIERIEIEGLFGRDSYRLEPPPTADPEFERFLVIYGGNGSGKTTILKLLYHLLSQAPRRNHRTFLGSIPFKRFGVWFRDGRMVEASRNEPSIGGYSLKLSDSSGFHKESEWTPEPSTDEPAAYHLLPDGSLAIVADRLERGVREGRRRGTNLDEWVSELATIVPESIFFLADDRRLHNDALRDDADPRRRRAMPQVIPQTEEDVDPRTGALVQALTRANHWIRDQVIGGSAIGGETTNAIYVQVAQRIATPSLLNEPGITASTPEIKARLLELGRRSDSFAELGLMPKAPAGELVAALEQTLEPQLPAMLSVLIPFADSLEARLGALEPIREVLATYLELINSFFGARKTVEFSLPHGIAIYTAEHEALDPRFLSSGETQLLLLLTSTIFTRNDSALYIIDEPELSLNMKWQRRLVEALAIGTRGTATSFVLASHSFELMAAARERVAALD